MIENNPQLDADELLHFAIRASQNKENEKAILYLKHALQQEPDNAKLHYFLGAQHAELGMFDRAVEEMTEAVTLDSKLETAHFQLGLLYATSGRVQEAEKAWVPLEELGETNPLYLFKTGLLHLTKDEFPEAKRHLTKGISLNNANPDLNNDMQRIVDNISQITDNNSTESANNVAAANESTAEQDSEAKSSHVFLSAYNTEDEEDKTH